MSNLAGSVRETAATAPDNTAISVAGVETSYEDLWTLVRQFGAGLRSHGIEPGDRVALWLPNLPQFVVAFYGTIAAGAVAVPLHPEADRRHVEYALSNCEARLVVTICDLAARIQEYRALTKIEQVVTADGKHAVGVPFSAFLADWTLELVPRGADEIAILAHTTGSNGKPVGVRLSHRNLHSTAKAVATHVLDLTPEDAQLGAFPLSHVYGSTVTLQATVLRGASYYPLSTWQPDAALDLVEQHRLTCLHATVPMYGDLLSCDGVEARDLSSLRFCGVSGARVPTPLVERFEERFDRPLCEAYGTSESTGITHVNTPAEHKTGSVGKSLPVVDDAVLTDELGAVPPVERGPVTRGDAIELPRVVGELVVSGPGVMRGYDESGRSDPRRMIGDRSVLRTGDVCYHDRDGFVYVVDSAEEIVETRYGTVFPALLEDRILEHADVADAAVVGARKNGSVAVAAFVVPQRDDQRTRESIKEHCRSIHADPVPSRIAFVPELPRTPIGSIQKRLLRRQVLD